MVVQHNMQAANANRMLNVTTGQQAKSTEKLSSGYRINRAADDAAGLTISEKMRKQIKGLDRASTNAEDGVSAVQTAEGALTEVHSMLQRMNELATQASNGTNSQSDRSAIQDEISQLTTEIDRVAETTKFNEIYLLKGDKSGATETDTVAAHDAGLAGKLGESADGKTTFTADALKVGSNVKIAGTEYKIVGSAKDTDYTDAKTYNDGNKTDGDKIIRGDKTYTYDAGATKWKDEAGNAQNNFTAVAGDTLIDKATGKTTTVMGDGQEAHTASTMDDVKAKIKDVAANDQVKINGHAYTVGTTTKADGSAYTADDIAALVKEGDLVDDGKNKLFVMSAAAKNENEISLNDAYAKMADELGKASSIGTDKAATVKNNGDGTFEITQGTVNVKKSLSFSLHVGADADMTNKINVDIETMNAAGLGIKGLTVKDDSGVAATYAIDAIADAVAKFSSQRSSLGAVQNRLEHTIANVDNVVENTTSAESRIRDTDMASEMVNYSKNNILAQAGQSMLAQANQSNQGVLSLLQ